jgi:hypothetical protein
VDVVMQDRVALTAIVKNCDHPAWLLWSTAELLNDKDFLLDLLALNGRIYMYLNLDMQRDAEIIKASLPDSFPHVPDHVQYMYPELVAQAISNADDLNDIFDLVADDLWSDRQIALAWVRSGGPYLDGRFPEEFEDDPDIFLAIAEHSPDDFYFASEVLYTNKEYMLQVVEKNGLLLDEVDSDLTDDYDLMLAAFAQGCNIVASYEAEHDSFRRLTRNRSQEDIYFHRTILA